jgi:uncharacterized protein (DUF2147 family)
MRPIRLAFLALVAACAAVPALAQGPTLEGRWKAPLNGAVIDIAPCGQAWCGKIVTSDQIKADPEARDVRNKDAALRDRKLVGLVMLQGFTGGPTEWTGGSVYNPDDGGTYTGKITAQGDDAIKLTGCIIFPLCKTQVWTRLK